MTCYEDPNFYLAGCDEIRRNFRVYRSMSEKLDTVRRYMILMNRAKHARHRLAIRQEKAEVIS